jgi:hypothetical protein
MLDVTLDTKFVVGTNIRGDMASADWRFLLPRLSFERVLCLGVPELPAVAVLSGMCVNMIIASSNKKRLAKAIAECNARRLANVQSMHVPHVSSIPCPSRGVDLIYIVSDKKRRAFLDDRTVMQELSRVLKEDGIIYFEADMPNEQVEPAATLNDLKKFDLSYPRVFRVTPLCGEMRTAVPILDTMTESFFREKVMEAPSFVSRAIERFSGKQRYAMITQRSQVEFNGHLPEYLSSVALSNGKDLHGYRWGMSAMGRRNTRKVLFFLLNKESGEAEAVIKLTRSAAFNARLENEYRALDHVSKNGVVKAGTFPQPLFFGHSGRLAMLGEKMIHGKPFRKATAATIDCAFAKAAFEWIINLGVDTVEAHGNGAARAAEVMKNLFDQFSQIYRLTIDEHAFLVKQIETIAQSPSAFPTVFQHGDPGIWNVMATDSGGVAFLDWEAAEQEGMPLWDLFYFLRSYGTWMSRRAGMRDSLKSFAKNFILPSEPSKLLFGLTQKYCERVHLHTGLVEPLFYTCWMHRALKEATRLTKAEIEKGHYVNLLRLCIENRQAAGLAQLFS